MICAIVWVRSGLLGIKSTHRSLASCIETCWIGMCYSVTAPIANDLVNELGISSVQSRLPVAMFLFGVSFGQVILTPLAEVRSSLLQSTKDLIYPFLHRIMAVRRS